MNSDPKEIKRVKNLLTLFFQYFNSYFQGTLRIYCQKVEDKVQRVDVGGAACTGAQAVFNMNDILAKLLPGIKQRIMEVFNINEELTRMARMAPFIMDAKIDDEGVKRTLATSCVEIFKSYEFIFRNITVKIKDDIKGEPMCAMKVLAEECVVAVINHLVLPTQSERTLSVALILESIQKLDSKRNKNTFIRGLEYLCSQMTSTVSQEGKNLRILDGKPLNATKVLANVGIVSETKVFFNQIGKSSTEKYSYRRLFPFEKIDPALHEEEPNQFVRMTEFEAILTDQNKQEMVDELLSGFKNPSNDFTAEITAKVDSQIKALSEVVGNHDISVINSKINKWKTDVTQKGKESAKMTVSNNVITDWTLNAHQGGS